MMEYVDLNQTFYSFIYVTPYTNYLGNFIIQIVK